ncbi:hypothetical protein AUEXF2481DRAFT_657119 [Aureobasidium subglaciale EXF-2481]|uniref:non-specific serine/threonine protein kinase n=1 Tax=Aureobasidium subglaciale (strain EXF-2481) TaxID=1043005 RepID=A0A074ZC35_AURSE|nr:uncharacterized protein AUEXF2481DRAFT_657119 [Aureobasidium subglaciale EXF-2481]KEQ96291.1 hypothetical protein AUEXF2481DRAFT_657119 [Aureobasidium subglaciale EXF-2481]
MAAAYSATAPGTLPQAVSSSSAPPGTFAPGTKVQVGSHRVVIEKYFSEGGFAHVYTVRVPPKDASSKTTIAVLKRVAVPDKDALANMRTEVETMKKLKGHKHIVTYIDSHASQLKGGGYEVFLLMEFCSGGGLIDFMNTRLQHRLTEPEILNIFGDVSEGVATMHYLKPPLLHRDLKVENVLITNSTKGAIYKLCDFGSTAPPRPAATTAHEGRIIEEDVQRHTTMQYRSPEMVDVWRRQPIDEKSDIWALGVLLYKLCYYTTPFEEVGQMAILNASFKYPHYPPFSTRLKALIGSCLREDPRQRPNIYQVISEVCSMRSTTVPIKDIYAQRTQSEAGRNQKLPDLTSPVASPPPAGISHASPIKQKQFIPDIAPMRRGRPTAAPQPVAAKTNIASAKSSDPFAALDSASNTIRSRAVDELSAKFPSLDEFSIAHSSGGFNFSSSKPQRNDPITSALADEVFAHPELAKGMPASNVEPVSAQKPTARPESRSKAEAPPKPKTLLHQPAPQKSNYSSNTIITSPSEVQSTQKALPKLPDVSKRPIWRVPDHSRSSSQPRASPLAQREADRLQPSAAPAQRPALLDSHRSKSQTATLTLAKQTTSSRPSLEGHRPSFGYEDNTSRARSANSRPRPVSAAYVDSNLDYLREQEAERKRPSLEIRRSSRSIRSTELNFDDGNIESDADFLRNLESNDGLSRRNSGKSAAHNKRSSLSSLSFSGTKNMLSGRFGDAFKRFEQTSGPAKAEKSGRASESGFRTPSPNPPMQNESSLLSPISGSETNETPRRPETTNTDLADLIETEDLPPEMRREMERLQLAQEEKRVSAAAAEYRSRGGAPPVPSKANMIQQRVQSLLDDGQKSPARKRQAEGYGRYTERTETEDVERRVTPTVQPTAKRQPPPIARKPATPVPGEVDMNLRYHKVRQSQTFPIPAGTYPLEHSVSAPAQRTGAAARPNAPMKPASLKTGGSSISQAASSGLASPVYSQASGAGRGPSLAALIARDSEGVAGVGAGANTGMDQGLRQESEFANQADFDDWQADFSKRYPSLGGIEMVEREIAATGGGGGRDGGRREMRVRDV